MKLDKIKQALVRKLGPLPTWAWAGLAVGGVWLWRMRSGAANLEEGGEEFAAVGQTAAPFTPSTPPAGGLNSGFETQVGGTEIGRVSTGGKDGGYTEVEGPFDFIERLFGGTLQPPAPVPVATPAPTPPPMVRLPAPKPPTLPTSPVRKPDPGGSTPKGRSYTVQRGDSLWAIARKFGYSHWNPIYTANKAIIGGNPDLIKPGQVLVLP
jgi:nucleoid-associated protein YgaU